MDESLGKQTNGRLEGEWMILKLLLVQKHAMNRGLHHITKVTQVLELNELLSEFQCIMMVRMKTVIKKLMYTP